MSPWLRWTGNPPRDSRKTAKTLRETVLHPVIPPSPLGPALLAAIVAVHCGAHDGLAREQKRSGEKSVRQAVPAPSTPPASLSGRGNAVDALPAPVAEMRDAILSAVKDGRIEDLKLAIELNELKPSFDAAAGTDSIAHLKGLSADGEGYEILAILGELLEGEYATVPGGRDIENNKVYVWPRLAELPLGKLTPAQNVDLLRLVPPPLAKEMKEKGRYSYWRLAIGADGTWHSFERAK